MIGYLALSSLSKVDIVKLEEEDATCQDIGLTTLKTIDTSENVD